MRRKTPAPCPRQGVPIAPINLGLVLQNSWFEAGKLLRLVLDIVVVHASASASSTD